MTLDHFRPLWQPQLPLPALYIQGRDWWDGSGNQLWVPRMASALSIMRPDRSSGDWATYLDGVVATGFNGIRTFAGALQWANQTVDVAVQRLPDLIAACAERGLVLEVVAVTDSGVAGYNWRNHLNTVATICAPHTAVILEGANELGHGTQAVDVVPAEIEAILRHYPNPWAVGAPGVDEPINNQWPAGQGWYSTVHLDRGRPRWEQQRRVREIYAVVEATGKPALDNEPLGADELDGSQTGRQRSNDPALFATLGALDAAFRGVGGVHHSQAGLHAVLPGPIQQQCAEAYVAAHMAVRTGLANGAGTYKNTGHSSSPVAAIDPTTTTRVYSFLPQNSPTAVSVHIGELYPSVVYAPGWQPQQELYTITGMDNRRLRVVQLVYR